jgi:LytS/YehU family sensor histidine kinase
MNPHFIFNALNSIQNFILKNKREDAYSYLSKFSQLVRKILDHSQQKIILLQEEMETINLYVNLEQLRFKNGFEYTLKTAKNTNLDEYYIPTMIIQPYVENAIWHGLMNLENRTGKLEIKISKKTNFLKIAILDNGIGRVKSNEYKTVKTHQSLATTINEKRINLLKKSTDFKNINVLIKDIYDENKIGIGTKVIIYLPINLF